MLSFEVVTLFPELFEQHLKHLPLKKGLEIGAIKINFHNIRDFAVDERGSVDDKPYGGGPGMVLRPEPVFDTVESIKRVSQDKSKSRVVLLSPAGQKYTQKKVREYSQLEQLILISGRYEGFDARIEEGLADEAISIGDYVLSGGEVPIMVILESVTRVMPGILEKAGASEIESFESNFVEYPQYTRPEEYRGMKVPEVLLSGNHAEIEKWRKEKSKPINP
ncbi:tRNA (guanosine(37)-N1)-methyltransferase TrmD [candidate division WWE3 bacterium RIFCSPHIGHO2_01_FULL_42_13]|uniref:tRNA (guanine-N(1)-)-methyltransferase n=1 Tax=candidate division WWE3 bacterium RIFCSPHIGHO2_01_FULL_42_13 TaxID=1802617 RepID=A0A1F4US47_UNCKA|nr:MAG: tRNA (guanosine(37)-N1)-methyltransferase TrmD [candidate division WWE3 bacterium RIFCSPHIGHO2_01_FULL_42_13]